MVRKRLELGDQVSKLHVLILYTIFFYFMSLINPLISLFLLDATVTGTSIPRFIFFSILSFNLYETSDSTSLMLSAYYLNFNYVDVSVRTQTVSHTNKIQMCSMDLCGITPII